MPLTPEQAIQTLRKALTDISETRFGWDGDCGVVRIADDALETTESIAPQALAPVSGAAMPAGELPNERAAFEAWAKKAHFSLRRDPELQDAYESQTTISAWEAWRAALAATQPQKNARDAARYRWLRCNWSCNYDRKDKQYSFFYDNRGELSGEAKSYNDIPDLESIIDAAIATESAT